MECFSRNDQHIITGQTAFVFGVGGLGAPLCVTLCRLGIGRLIIHVEASNLNRQILYSKEDVGDLKVDAAKRTSTLRWPLLQNIAANHLCVEGQTLFTELSFQ